MRVPFLLCPVLVCAVLVCEVLGQEFEAASVRLSGERSVRGSSGGPGSRDPERYVYNKAFLRDLLFTAYGLTDYREQIAGPGWIDTEAYDVVATLPVGATKEQFRQMLQNLLVERFQLVVHHETVVLPVFDLVVAKGGPKLKESAKESVPAQAGVEAAPPSTGPGEDFPKMPPGTPGLAANYSVGPNGQQQIRMRAQQQTMAAFAGMLGLPSNAGRIVFDKTGLTGRYDFTFFFEIPPSRAGAEAEPTLSVFDALEQQLGLKLVDAKQSFDKIVIDHAERVPAEN